MSAGLRWCSVYIVRSQNVPIRITGSDINCGFIYLPRPRLRALGNDLLCSQANSYAGLSGPSNSQAINNKAHYSTKTHALLSTQGGIVDIFIF